MGILSPCPVLSLYLCVCYLMLPSKGSEQWGHHELAASCWVTAPSLDKSLKWGSSLRNMRLLQTSCLDNKWRAGFPSLLMLPGSSTFLHETTTSLCCGWSMKWDNEMKVVALLLLILQGNGSPLHHMKLWHINNNVGK